jgi:hypothetical protein
MDILEIWAIWRYWSLVATAVVMLTGYVIVKVISRPSDPYAREAQRQYRINRRNLQSPFRRITVTLLIFMFMLMASSIFVIAIYNIFD